MLLLVLGEKWDGRIGLSLGLLVGYALGHAIAAQLYGIAPDDPATFMIAVRPPRPGGARLHPVPAFRAITVIPVFALREE